MDQYIKTPLYLQNLKVTSEATFSYIHDVSSYVIHGDLKEPNYKYCPYCHCMHMHQNGTRKIRLRHISIGKENHMKTKEELNALKEEVDTLNKKLAELTEDELKQVSGGGYVVDAGALTVGENVKTQNARIIIILLAFTLLLSVFLRHVAIP